MIARSRRWRGRRWCAGSPPRPGRSRRSGRAPSTSPRARGARRSCVAARAPWASRLGQTFDDRREVGPRVDERQPDPESGQPGQHGAAGSEGRAHHVGRSWHVDQSASLASGPRWGHRVPASRTGRAAGTQHDGLQSSPSVLDLVTGAGDVDRGVITSPGGQLGSRADPVGRGQALLMRSAVRDEEHRLVPPFPYVEQEILQRGTGLHVDRDKRFVHQRTGAGFR